MSIRPEAYVYRVSGNKWHEYQDKVVFQFSIGLTNSSNQTDWRMLALVLPKPLLWPALALAAFLTWKAAWAAVERRRRQPGLASRG